MVVSHFIISSNDEGHCWPLLSSTQLSHCPLHTCHQHHTQAPVISCLTTARPVSLRLLPALLSSNPSSFCTITSVGLMVTFFVYRYPLVLQTCKIYPTFSNMAFRTLCDLGSVFPTRHTPLTIFCFQYSVPAA